MDIKQQDIGLLMALDALLAEQNVTRAAERLNLSQPAMSAQLARLRVLFGDPLLVPSGKRMVPTVRALDIQAPLNRVLADLTAVIRDGRGFDPAQSDRIFRIVATDYLHRTVSCDSLHRVAERAPALRLALMAAGPERLWPMLERDDVDFLITSERLTPPEAKARRLFTERFRFVQRKGHPRGASPPGLAEFCRLKHVLVSPDGGGFSGAVDAVLADLGCRRHVVLSLPSFLVAVPMIASSDLVAVLPERLGMEMQDTLEVMDLPFAMQGFDVMLSWHVRHQRDAGHKWMRDVIVESAA